MPSKKGQNVPPHIQGHPKSQPSTKMSPKRDNGRESIAHHAIENFREKVQNVPPHIQENQKSMPSAKISPKQRFAIVQAGGGGFIYTFETMTSKIKKLEKNKIQKCVFEENKKTYKM